MTVPTPSDTQLYLTTREVADLIRVKERKVYDLAAADEIPHRRVTGKLLFPKQEILAWIEGGTPAPDRERPAVVTGSHDPLLDWAIRESGCGLATLFNGSTDGLERFAEGGAMIAGLHIPDGARWNIDAITGRGMRDCVLIRWAVRRRGLIVAPALAPQVQGLSDLSGTRFVQRQPGAGAQTLLTQQLRTAGLDPDPFDPASPLAHTESDAAAMIADGEAEAAMGLEGMAKRFSLHFVPLVDEFYDLLIDRRAYFSAPVQALVGFMSSERLTERAQAITGYDLSQIGAVRWNAP